MTSEPVSVARLERLLGKASEAPWESGPNLMIGGWHVELAKTNPAISPGEHIVANFVAEPDAALIAEARNALPALLAVARAAAEMVASGPPSGYDQRDARRQALRDALAALDLRTADSDGPA